MLLDKDGRGHYSVQLIASLTSWRNTTRNGRRNWEKVGGSTLSYSIIIYCLLFFLWMEELRSHGLLYELTSKQASKLAS